MIDHDLSNQLHSLAATVDEPFDLVALHRRISAQSRRRAVVKVGFAGAGVAVVVGGLIVVREQRHPAESLVPAASPVASNVSQVDTTAQQVEPTAWPDCAVVLAGLRAANSTPDSIVVKDVPPDASASAGEVPGSGFKAIVTILTIDGPRLTFRSDEPNIAPATGGTGTLDAATVWVDGPTQLDTPPTLQVGDQVGLAALMGSDGIDHVLFVDVSASASSTAAPEPSQPDATIVVPGPSLPPGPTEKSVGSITAVDVAAITVTFDDRSGQARTVAIDLASTPFYAGDTQCVPGSLSVGAQVGVAYHFDDAGKIVSDAAMLMP